jgi:2-oxoglutarate ferredoxin oxidoreductase subunit beta
MEHAGFSIVHVQSPCTTYNDTFIELKGDLKNGIQPTIWDVPEDHDPSDRAAAYDLLQQGGVPVGLIYKDTDRPSLDQSVVATWEKAQPKTVEQLMGAFEF